MGITHERFSAMFYFRTLDQLNLRSEKIDAVLTVNRALGDVHFARHHHLAGGLELWRCLINQERFHEQAKADR